MAKTILERYGEFAAKNPEIVIGAAIIFTTLMLLSAANLEIDTDFQSSLPQEIDVVRNENLVTDTFTGSDRLLILVKLNNEKASDDEIRDIRDVRVIRKLDELEGVLRNNPDISAVVGAPDVLKSIYGTLPEDDAQIKAVLDGTGGLVSRDFTLTVLTLSVNTGTDDKKIMRVEEKIRDDIETVGFPGSIDFSVTGGPLIQTTIFSLLTSDLARTMSIAGVFILLVLIISYRSPIKGTFAVLLLMMAILWTGGTMQLLNVPLSIVTALVGSMIIGIGIDYTIHMMNRYDEERAKGISQHGASGIATNHVGVAIIATSITTIVSFLSQGTSGIPFLLDLGIALSLGIFYGMIAAMIVLPALIIVEENLSKSSRKFLRGMLNED